MLSRKEILQAIARKELRITPFDRSAVGAVSVDLRLGNEFKVFEGNHALEVTEDAKMPGKKVRLKGSQELFLEPGQFVLGMTREKLTLAKNIAGKITGRSRFARMGLMVHVSSSLIQPGVDNVQVLEIVNLSPVPLKLRPGVRICQVLFDRLGGKAEYRGRYRKQRGV